jgi:hypothetical protein
MAQFARPDADDTDGNWTNESGGTTLFSSIDESSASDTDFIQVDDSSSNEICIVRLSDVSTPSSGSAFIKYRALTADGSEMGAPGLKVELLQDSTVKATTTNNSVSTSSFTNYSHEITDVSGISDWTDLKFRITMLTNTGANDTMKVSQAFLETQDASSGGSDPRKQNLAMTDPSMGIQGLGNNFTLE